MRAQGIVYDRTDKELLWSLHSSLEGEARQQGATYLFLKCLSINWNPASWLLTCTNALIGCDAVRGLQRIPSSAVGPIHPQVWSVNGRGVASVGT